MIDTVTDGLPVKEVKCLVCGFRPPSTKLKQAHSISAHQRKSLPPSRKRSEPRTPIRKTDSDDWESYAASIYFWQKATQLKEHRERMKDKSERAKLRHLQGLFDALVNTMELRRKCWARLRKRNWQTQRTTGRASGIKDKEFNELQTRYVLLMRQAMVWQPDDPLVRAFAGSCRALGQYEFLRGAGKGLETGVKRPFPSARHAMADVIINDLGDDGVSAEKIRIALIKKNLPAQSREAIRNRVSYDVIVRHRKRS